MYRGIAAGFICGLVVGICIRTIIEIIKLYRQPDQEDNDDQEE